MAFGQSQGPPASAKQVQYLKSLVEKAGHASFREARHPLGLTQRQAGGKFTRTEASALIDQLLAAENDHDVAAGPDGETMEQQVAAARLEAEQLHQVRGIPATMLAGELERRGWSVSPPPGAV